MYNKIDKKMENLKVGGEVHFTDLQTVKPTTEIVAITNNCTMKTELTKKKPENNGLLHPTTSKANYQVQKGNPESKLEQTSDDALSMLPILVVEEGEVVIVHQEFSSDEELIQAGFIKKGFQDETGLHDA